MAIIGNWERHSYKLRNPKNQWPPPGTEKGWERLIAKAPVAAGLRWPFEFELLICEKGTEIRFLWFLLTVWVFLIKKLVFKSKQLSQWTNFWLCKGWTALLIGCWKSHVEAWRLHRSCGLSVISPNAERMRREPFEWAFPRQSDRGQAHLCTNEAAFGL